MRPDLTAAEVAQIELQLAGLASLLEFGCGEATIVAARQVRRIVSVDSDPARLRKPDCVFLIRDFNERPEYHAVLRHLDVLTRVDGLGILRAKRQVDGTAVLHDLFDHYLDPD